MSIEGSSSIFHGMRNQTSQGRRQWARLDSADPQWERTACLSPLPGAPGAGYLEFLGDHKLPVPTHQVLQVVVHEVHVQG